MMDRHFSATTYLLDSDKKRTLMHFHSKLQTWLPPGGHMEVNEAPFEAATREIYEEYGLRDLKFIHPVSKRKLDSRSYMLEMPHFLIEEKIAKDHIHLDWIFFAWVSDKELKKVESVENYRWFTFDELKNEEQCFENVKDLATYAMNQFYNGNYYPSSE